MSSARHLTREYDSIDEIRGFDVLLVAILRRGDGLHHHHPVWRQQCIARREEGPEVVVTHSFDLRCMVRAHPPVSPRTPIK